MPEPDVVGGKATSVHLESRVVVGRRHPIGARRYPLEVPTTPGAVALRHLALQGEELAALGHLHEDTLYTALAELVRDRFICHALILTQGPVSRSRKGPDPEVCVCRAAGGATLAG